MTGIRETKKATTRTTLARCTAELAYEHGVEGMTVAAITAAAGVSQRTFHNYFDSREKALLTFIESSMEKLGEKLAELAEGSDPISAVEQLIIGETISGAAGVDSFLALDRLTRALLSTNPADAGEHQLATLRDAVDRILTERLGLTGFEDIVAVHATLHSGFTALIYHEFELRHGRDVDDPITLLRRAFAVVRGGVNQIYTPHGGQVRLSSASTRSSTVDPAIP
ncbi:TetR/AcrR family transcriptional regulator [Corynebacterium sp. CCM 9185]|uniref:TetR/AcrR family transcriptional regulator n=1 Tax=Corynebacterium marambiense TaxID=2765364 RepID=A0ABS0VTB6_9CORY|nr:TetR/AcrR family transcriptional regulator [Corynebacterium marambiense]MBI9000015.1 TetR/AcrR family transcriptional regulator [Corynebacterium marambiense]MCK7663367.1 TetR/AcrR family transcriptional regulator [Corynebacterium marambiense]MCX7542198.1 TetR/AcrR family transcriptional regulator [Corynebacterium marambiense]